MSTNGWDKYLRVFPILGLLFYYFGGLMAGLEAADMAMFLAWLIVFSLVELIGLLMKRKELLILGALLLILFSIGPILAISGGIFRLIALGGIVMAFAITFHLLTIYVWIKQ